MPGAAQEMYRQSLDDTPVLRYGPDRPYDRFMGRNGDNYTLWELAGYGRAQIAAMYEYSHSLVTCGTISSNLETLLKCLRLRVDPSVLLVQLECYLRTAKDDPDRHWHNYIQPVIPILMQACRLPVPSPTFLRCTMRALLPRRARGANFGCTRGPSR